MVQRVVPPAVQAALTVQDVVEGVEKGVVEKGVVERDVVERDAVERGAERVVAGN